MHITTSRKKVADALVMDTKTKCGEELEVILHSQRNPRLVIRNIPEDVTKNNIEGTLLKQNPDLNLNAGTSMLNTTMKRRNFLGTWYLSSTPRAGSSSCQ